MISNSPVSTTYFMSILQKAGCSGAICRETVFVSPGARLIRWVN